jgi:hypothetical protein
MITKLFEIRDRATFIPCFAILMESNEEVESYLLRRAGYGPATNMVIFGRADGHGKAFYDPYDYCDRTMKTAHQYIADNFHTLQTGDVVCVETILGERPEPKISERLEVL